MDLCIFPSTNPTKSVVSRPWVQSSDPGTKMGKSEPEMGLSSALVGFVYWIWETCCMWWKARVACGITFITWQMHTDSSSFLPTSLLLGSLRSDSQVAWVQVCASSSLQIFKQACWLCIAKTSFVHFYSVHIVHVFLARQRRWPMNQG